jgi:hypothetical protein
MSEDVVAAALAGAAAFSGSLGIDVVSLRKSRVVDSTSGPISA